MKEDKSLWVDPKENAECTNISKTNQKLKEKLDKFKK